MSVQGAHRAATFKKGQGTEPWSGWFEFAVNGTSDPSLTTLVGPLAPHVSALTYSATGKIVVTFKSTFKFPANSPKFFVCNTSDSGTLWWCFQLAVYDATNRQMTIQCVAGACVATAISANANNLIRILVEADLTRT
jgi:hypothetical protein